MRRPRTIVLMGLRGSGKSSVGRELAVMLGCPAIDLDNLTPGLLGGGSVADVWARHGESAFREAEARALCSALDSGPIVLSLGGGTPTVPAAAERLRSETKAGSIALVYLHAGPAVLRQRLEEADNSDRPSLTGSGTLCEVEAVYGTRDPLYRALATMIIETEGLDPRRIAAAITERIDAE